MKNIGTVTSINTSEKTGTVKSPVESGEFKTDFGIVGDAHAGKNHKQISLLGLDSFKKMTDAGVKNLSAGRFGENLTVDAKEIYKLPVGTKLQIGETLHEISQVGKTCHNGCEIKSLTGECIMPLEGIFTKVLSDGVVRVGDGIEVVA